MNIYVGNLPYKFTGEDLKQKFSEFGTVVSANVVTDRETGRSKGFGFVEMSDNDSTNKAVEALANWDADGRKIRVSLAKPREEKKFSGGGRRQR
ncbi:MAG: RNA-binding protein [Candidatus Sericytochromatia bacterium]